MHEKRDRAQVVTENALRMLDIAREKLGNLSPAEEKLFQAVANGKSADYSVDSEEDNDPARAEKWGDERMLKADRIAWLCTDPRALMLVTYRGIGVKGAKIDGELDLECVSVSFPLDFEKSCVAEGINLGDAEIGALYLRDTYAGKINGDGVDIKGNVCLSDGCKIEGEVCLLGATIGGNLECDESQFINPGGYALDANGVEVDGSVFLRDGFKAEGEVCLLGATIGGCLDCENGQFINPKDEALTADGLKVDGSVFLRNGFKAKGQVRLLGATIGGQFSCIGGQFINKNKVAKAFWADRVKVEGDVLLRENFEAEGEVCLLGAIVGGSLECDDSQFINPGGYALNADGVEVEGYVFLRNGFKAEGEVCLLSATIGRSLVCEKGQFINPGGYALFADVMKIDRNVFLGDGFEAKGEVRLSGATIGGQVDCSGGQFINKNKDRRALSADDMNVQGSVFLSNRFKAEGEVCLLGATIGGHLECENGHLMNPGGCALSADRLKVESCVHLCNGFKAEGEVCLFGARIGGSLNCGKGQFINPDGCALNGDGLKVEGCVSLDNGFKAEGEVRLYSTTIGEYINCDTGQFINQNEESSALFADGVKVERDVFLRKGFKAEGEVRLLGATIGGNLECDEGQFINPSGLALNADGMNVYGYVFLRNGFKAEGEVRLLVARIGRNLECDNGRFINKEERAKALNADGLKVEGDVLMRNGFKAEGEVCLLGATIGGDFVWTGVTSPTEFTLDLRSARIGTLWDEQKSWPEKGKLFLHGLVYGEIDDDAPIDAKTRIDWLHRQPTENFRMQPYEQLAAVLRKVGHDADAKKILIAKAKDRARLTQLTWPEKCWHHVSGKFIGYGYRPWRAFWIGLMVVVIGWFLFGIGFQANVMTPTKEVAYVSDNGEENRRLSENYPKFNALVYSLDMFVPLVNLHQAIYWLPNANQGDALFNIKGLRLLTGSLLRYYLWFHIVMGWILTTLLVVGLTGSIRS